MALDRIAQYFRSQGTPQGEGFAQMVEGLKQANGGDIAPEALGLEPMGEGRRTSAPDDLIDALTRPALPALVARGSTEERLLATTVHDAITAGNNKGELMSAFDTTTRPVYEYFVGKLPQRNAIQDRAEKVLGKGSVSWKEQPTTIGGTQVRYGYNMEYSVHGHARSPKKVTALLHSHYESAKPELAETPKLEMTFVNQRLDSIELTFGKKPEAVFDLIGENSMLGRTLLYLARVKRGFSPRDILSWPTNTFSSQFGTVTLENLTSQPVIRIRRDDVAGQAEFIYNENLPGFEIRTTNPDVFYDSNPLIGRVEPFIELTDQENVKILLKDMIGLILSEIKRK